MAALIRMPAEAAADDEDADAEAIVEVSEIPAPLLPQISCVGSICSRNGCHNHAGIRIIDRAKFHASRRNDAKMTPIVKGVYLECPDFTVSPASVKNDDHAAMILFYGMSNGIFAGRALKSSIGDLEKGQAVDFFNARRIIHGVDRAGVIQGDAKTFDFALHGAAA